MINLIMKSTKSLNKEIFLQPTEILHSFRNLTNTAGLLQGLNKPTDKNLVKNKK